jgi:hypothetical protein
MKLGTSQQAVLDYLKAKGPVTSQQVGDALYANTSSAAQYGGGTGHMGGKATPEQVRRAWAGRLLGALREKDLVTENIGLWAARGE